MHRFMKVMLGTATVAAVALAAIALPAGGAPKTRLGQGQLAHLSQAVSLRTWIANPSAAPETLRPRIEGIRQFIGKARPLSAPSRRPQRPTAGLFNADDLGLPQNEESVNACRSDHRVALEGTNDYRGLVDPDGNFTGWHLSVDGGRSLANEGLLPPVAIGADQRPSGGDPVVTIDDQTCDLYMVDLNYDPNDPEGNTNGIGVYRTDAATLQSCPGGADPSCWPTRRAAAAGAPPHFLDKPWADVERSGAAGKVVWVSYSDFTSTGPGSLDFTASIFAVRCDAALTSCTAPIKISGADPDVQFSWVTIGPDGRTYLSWSEIQGELEGTPQTFVHKLRVAEPGSTTFGPTRIIATETQPLPFGGLLHANDFRVATAQKHDVAIVDGHPRIFDVWDACAERPLDTICVEPAIKLSWSDDLGATWTTPAVISRGGDNYFPSVSSDGDGSLAVSYFTNRFDPVFHNRQDVELLTVNARNGNVRRVQRLTRTSNESEADPLLGGAFIGDYIQVFADRGRAWTGYNANYRSVPLLGDGTPLPQQDNYLSVDGL